MTSAKTQNAFVPKSPLSAEMAALMDAYNASSPVPYSQLGAQGSREAYRAATERGRWHRSESIATSEIRLAGYAARIYWPKDPVEQNDSFIVYIHGGGFVMGDLETHHSIHYELTHAASLPVVAITYPLAPEQPFPAAPMHIIETLRQLHERRAELGLPAGGISLVGDSAGGNLALVAALELAYELPILSQALLYPATDLRCETASFDEFTQGYPITRDTARWFTSQYLTDSAAAVQWMASPCLAQNLASCPPTYLLTVGHDPLRDEGLELAHKLTRGCVALTHHHMPAHVHGFLTQGAQVPEAQIIVDEIAHFLTEHSHSSSTAR